MSFANIFTSEFEGSIGLYPGLAEDDETLLDSTDEMEEISKEFEPGSAEEEIESPSWQEARVTSTNNNPLIVIFFFMTSSIFILLLNTL